VSAPTDQNTHLLGYWFHLSIDNHDVDIHGSAFSGREQLWIDGQPVFDTRSFKMKTEHTIDIDDEVYTLSIGYNSIWDQVRGSLSVSVHQGDELIAAATESISPWTIGCLYAVMVLAMLSAVLSSLYL
jgi:hypothetical protein